MKRVLRSLFGAVLLIGVRLAFTDSLHAQELRGVVVMADGATPASGVVAVLMHGTRKDSIVARGVTNERGRFALKLPAMQTATLRLLRIGFEPMDGGTFSLGQGETRDVMLTLHEKRIQLATFDVKESARCQIQPTGAQLVAQLFQQARTALISSTSPLTGTAAARYVNFDRQQDKRRKLLTPVSRSVKMGETLRPYSSISVDSLEKAGYIVPEGSDFNYYAPDAEVLLSDKFLSQHCLQLVNGTDSLAGSIGIGFRPVASRRNIVDIQGTLWLDKTTSALRYLDYTYTELPDYARNEGLGGRVEYAQLPDGGWFVNRWFIRMPLLTTASQTLIAVPGVRAPDRIVTSGYLITGGEVHEIRVDDRVLFLNTGAERAGSMPGDDLSPGVAVAVRPGVDRPADGVASPLDAESATALCGNELTYRHEGLVHGRVFDTSNKAFVGATVKAAWKEDFHVNSAMIRWAEREMTTKSIAGGSYLLCGIPVRIGVTISATRTQKYGRTSIVRVSEELPAARLDVILEPPSDGGKR